MINSYLSHTYEAQWVLKVPESTTITTTLDNPTKSTENIKGITSYQLNIYFNWFDLDWYLLWAAGKLLFYPLWISQIKQATYQFHSFVQHILVSIHRRSWLLHSRTWRRSGMAYSCMHQVLYNIEQTNSNQQTFAVRLPLEIYHLKLSIA